VAAEDAGRVDLAIDTASNRGGLALLEGDAVIAEHGWDVSTNYSLELLSTLDGLLREAGVTRAELASIAVNVGPGGYGGLRTGIAAAQGMALALDIPLAGVGRLEVEALPHLDGATPVVAVHDAGRGNVAWAAYAASEGREPPAVLVEPRLDSVESCIAGAPLGARWCGELGGDLGEALRRARDAAGRSGETEFRGERRVVDLVALARLRDAYGDPALVDAVYLRPPPITRPN
jgi:tRNA threonylcarbamoyl adenosine modification protein YeaZ